jgi:hypothetical protein
MDMPFDPTGDYLRPPLQGYHLVNDSYVAVPTTTQPNGTIVLPSQALGLELHLQGKEMRFYDPATQQYLLSYEEEVAAREAAEERAQTAEERAERLAAKLRELNIDPDL